jgi:TusA-related sulfurtransferase
VGCSGDWLRPCMVIPMKPDQRLDVSGVILPISLALCKNTLTRMAAGTVLEIRLQDHDTLQDLLIIVGRSGDTVLTWEKHDEYFYLWVQKNSACP